MSVVSLRRAAACALLLSTAATCAAATAPPASIESVLQSSSSVAIRQGTVAGEVAHQGQLQQFANGDSMLLQGSAAHPEGEPILVILCERAVYFNTVGGLPDGMRLQGDALKGARMAQYMAVLGAAAMVQGTAGRGLVLPEPGQRVDTTSETSWAYGKEQFAVAVQRLDDQGLQIRTTKLATRTTTPATGPDDAFSTDEDRAARLAELEPVGTWRELVIAVAPRAPQIPATMSLQGWVSNDGATAATVAQARIGCAAD